MGLAASQARLLFVTARKNDVEFQEMRVANQKIALSRESAAASEAYSDALNSRKLMWAVDGSATGDKEVDLTYDLLMRPNTTADSGQYIYTNSSNGKVILDNKYITTLGLPSTGNPDALDRAMTQAQFLMKLMGIDAKTAENYVMYGNTNVTGKFTTNYDDSDIISAAGLQTVNATNIALSGDIGSTNPSDDGTNSAIGAFEEQLGSIANSLGNALNNKIIGQIGVNYQSQITAALQKAQTETFNKFVYNTTSGDTGGTPTVKTVGVSGSDKAVSGAEGSNQIVFSNWTTKAGRTWGNLGGLLGGKNPHGEYAVDGAQIIKTFLTFFDQECAKNLPDGAAKVVSGTIGGSSTTRTGTGGTGTKISAGNTPSTNKPDANNNGVGDAYEASFYLNLYNAINSFGWQTNNDLTNKANLQAQILYGNVEIDQLQTDGSWKPISTSNSDTPLRNEADDEKIAQAEAKYNAEKANIDSKEKKLDLQMKTLDTERSALDTEIDSVKQIINKNIERSFKMFQA